MRGGEVRALEPPVGGAPVHHRHEAALGPGEVPRQRDRRIVARHDQQSVQERLEPHAPAAWQQADARPRVVQRRPCDAHGVVRVAPLHDEQGGHDLREARHRQDEQRPVAPQHVARVHVEHEPGARRAPKPHVEGVDP
jgi:hypothetical protein